MIDISLIEKFVTLKLDVFTSEFSGLQVVESEDTLEVACDLFSSIPLFLYKSPDNNLVLFSDFNSFIETTKFPLKIDKAGFWEIVVFGSGVWDRTLFQEIKQLPSASKITIIKKTNSFTIKKYYDFNILENKAIDTLEKATDLAYEKINVAFSKLDPLKKYIMGMSGGMDSRIALAFLSKHVPSDKVELFTYGFDKNILEYKYALECAQAVGFNPPKFHELKKTAYSNAVTYFPKLSGGQIGIHHCHIADYLSSNDSSNSHYISTYYSDAVMGWEAKGKKWIDFDSSNSYQSIIAHLDYLDRSVKDEISSDSVKVFESLNANANFSSLDEYKYVTERNVKFHVYLAFIQSQLLKDSSLLVLPFADKELLESMLSIPLKFRKNKQLIDSVLEKYFPELSDSKIGNVSSRFQWGAKYSSSYDFYKFKFLNRINAILRPLTKGNIQMFNSFQTEELDRVLHSDFSSDLKAATKLMNDLNVMTNEQTNLWNKLPLKSIGVCERFSIISIGALVAQLNDRIEKT